MNFSGINQPQSTFCSPVNNFVPLHPPTLQPPLLSPPTLWPPNLSLAPSYPPTFNQYFGYTGYGGDDRANAHPFTLCFVSGNISVCHGCKQRYVKDAGPPYDLCVKHEEWRTFRLSAATDSQSRFGNVYYHANAPCIRAIWPMWLATSLIVPPDLPLEPIHKDFLASHFGIHI